MEPLLGYWKSLLEAWTSKFEFCNFIGFSLNVIPVSGRHWARQVSGLTVRTPIDNLRSTTWQSGKFYKSYVRPIDCMNKRQFFVYKCPADEEPQELLVATRNTRNSVFW